MANCITCIHQEVCKERMEIFNLPNIACQYEAHELVGEWVLDKEISFIFNIYECSKCRFNGSKRWHFCPNCGADMREEGDSE